MHKKLISLLLVPLMLFTSVVSIGATDESTQIKNIIYLIPDGGGYPLYDFANMVKVKGGFNPELFPNKTYTDTEPMSMRTQLAGSMMVCVLQDGAQTETEVIGRVKAMPEG